MPVRPLKEKAVLPAAHRERVPISDVTPDHRVAQERVHIQHTLDLLRGGFIRIHQLKQRDQMRIIVLRFVGPLQPFGPVTPRVIRALVTPVGVLGISLPIVHEPPLVIHPVKLAVIPVSESAAYEIVMNRLSVFPQINSVIVHYYAHDLVFIHRVAQQIEPVTRHPIMEIAPCRIIVVVHMVMRSEQAISRQLELRPVQSSTPRPWAAAIASLPVIKDCVLIMNVGAVEIAVRVAWIFELVLGRVPIRNGANVMLRHDKPHRAEVSRQSPIIHHQ